MFRMVHRYTRSDVRIDLDQRRVPELDRRRVGKAHHPDGASHIERDLFLEENTWLPGTPRVALLSFSSADQATEDVRTISGKLLRYTELSTVVWQSTAMETCLSEMLLDKGMRQDVRRSVLSKRGRVAVRNPIRRQATVNERELRSRFPIRHT